MPPRFSTSSTSFTIPDYVGRLRRKELVINREYQRTDKVWPRAAQSFLIESILLGYPIPKISIREITDLATLSTSSEIIDGQQRTRAIIAYHDGEFAISKNSEVLDAQNKRYAELPEDLQRAFMTFKIQADVIAGADDADIIELFRRINSYTVALNAEEQRHAAFQGDMKWFVYELARDYSPTLERFGVMSLKQLSRMQDTKLIAEIVHAIFNGITTTTAKSLNGMYNKYNKELPEAEELADRFKAAFEHIQTLDEIARTALCKHYHFYSLILALMHSMQTIPSLEGDAEGGKGLLEREAMVANLLTLAEVVYAEEPTEGYEDFWAASTQTTNTAANRKIRFVEFMKAVSRG